MPKPTNKVTKAQQKARETFENLHDELHSGKKIDYNYQPKHVEEKVRLYLYGDKGYGLVLFPDGTYKLD